MDASLNPPEPRLQVLTFVKVDRMVNVVAGATQLGERRTMLFSSLGDRVKKIRWRDSA